MARSHSRSHSLHLQRWATINRAKISWHNLIETGSDLALELVLVRRCVGLANIGSTQGTVKLGSN
jgi:hypothetical protein